jgi:hypothetical protein
MKNEYLYDRFNFTEEYKKEIIEMLRHNTNVEIGGYRLWDGQRTHLMQSPWELTDFIFALKKHETNTGNKLNSFLEVGFAAGAINSIINKFFNFKNIVGLDLFSSSLNSANLIGNMFHKNLSLICGNTRSDYVKDIANKLGPYDLIFIDADHTYEGVKMDFNNYLPMLSAGGVIGFHDVECPDWTGINKFWNELESTNKYNMQKFVKKGFSLQYGIGMLTVK